MHEPSKRIMPEEELLVSAHTGMGRPGARRATKGTNIDAKSAES